MVERDLDFAGLVAIVNNNLIAYDQSRDLAFTIDSAMRPSDDSHAPPGRPSDHTGTFGPQGADGATEALVLPETAVHLDMEDACRCARHPPSCMMRSGACAPVVMPHVGTMTQAQLPHCRWHSCG